jgi:hypothetical protein
MATATTENTRELTSTKVGCFAYTGAAGVLLTQICTK